MQEFNYESNEFFNNMTRYPDILSKEREAFVEEERKKSLVGVNINGVQIPGTLYFGLNHWKMFIDEEDEYGISLPKALKPRLRDTDWVMHNGLYKCEHLGEKDESGEPLEKEFLVIGGARQIGKTAFESMVIGRDLCLLDDIYDLLVCSNSLDLENLKKYIFFGIQNCTDFFSLPRMTQNKDATQYDFGRKFADNTSIVKSHLLVRNTSGGKSAEVSAGVTIFRGVFDEIAKADCLNAVTAVKPAMRSKGKLRSAGIMTFTGGDVEKSKDAESIFGNPKQIGGGTFTTEGKETGLFIDGTYGIGYKEETPLSKYLGVQGEELSKIKIDVTNLEKAHAKLDYEEEQASKSLVRTTYVKQIIYYPRKISHMFMTPDTNPFDIDRLYKVRERLLANPIGTPVELFRDEFGNVKHKISKKLPIMKYPLTKDDIYIDKDAPIVVYDFPKYEDNWDLHLMGNDSYNQDITKDGDSLGSFYVLRQAHSDITDPWQNRVVCSFTARPSKVKKFFETCELIQEWYNGQILFEHSGNGFLQYFDDRHKGHVLMDTFNLQQEINPKSRAGNVKGMKANETNNTYRLNAAVSELEKDVGDGLTGYDLIPDIMLVEELIAFDGVKNVDRYDAWSYGIVHLNAKKKYNTRPFLVYPEGKPKEEVKRKPTKNLLMPVRRTSRSAFGK